MDGNEKSSEGIYFLNEFKDKDIANTNRLMIGSLPKGFEIIFAEFNLKEKM